MNLRNWIVIGGTVWAFLAVDFVLPQVIPDHAERSAMILMGICIGQVNLIAAWAALAPGNIVLRLPWSILLSVMMWYAIVLGRRVSDTYMSLDDAVILGTVLLGGVAIAQIPLWIAGRVFRWRLVARAAWTIQTPQGRFQFHLQHLLLATAILSIALAPARVVLPPGDIGSLHLDHNLPVLLAAVTICNLLVAVPCIWGAFLKMPILVPLAFGWLVVYCVLLTAGEYGALVAILGPPGSDGVPISMYLLNVSQCAAVFGTLLILRGIGFQLVRGYPLRQPANGMGTPAGLPTGNP